VARARKRELRRDPNVAKALTDATTRSADQPRLIRTANDAIRNALWTPAFDDALYERVDVAKVDAAVAVDVVHGTARHAAITNPPRPVPRR
jgi:hypothetical protein